MSRFSPDYGGAVLFHCVNYRVDKVLLAAFHGLSVALWTTSDGFTLVLLQDREVFPTFTMVVGCQGRSCSYCYIMCPEQTKHLTSISISS